MNPDTGAIAIFETDGDAKKAGYTIPLSRRTAGKMLQMTKGERLGLISGNVNDLVRVHYSATLAGLTGDEVRKLRNAAKRARRARR